MKIRGRALVSLAIAGIAGVALAVTLGTAGASPLTITLGSTAGSPTQNLSGANTYVPFTDATTPTLQAPFNGTITSFSVNSGSAGNVVELRVLQPAGGGKFTAVETSPAETLVGGVSTFTGLSLPVTTGDVIGLDNSSSAIMFDTSVPTQHTAYYTPPLANGQTGASNNSQNGYRLLLSATMQESANTSPSATATETVTKTVTTGPRTPPPALSNVSESNTAWRESGKTAKHKPPVGTTFSFRLSEAARVTLSFFQQLTGRSIKGTCVAPSSHNRHAPACTRALAAGTLQLNERSGTDRVSFHGRISSRQVLKPGSYTVLISATNSAGEPSNAESQAFTLTSK